MNCSTQASHTISAVKTLLCVFMAASLCGAASTVTLPASQLFRSGNVQCGFINGAWVPGRILAHNKFYPRTAERRDLLNRARRASGVKKRRLTQQARAVQTAFRREAPVCRLGPGAATPTPSPAATVPGSSTPTATPVNTPPITLNTINERTYHTEHSLFIIPATGQVDWNSPTSWDSLYSTSNIASYLATLRATFPDDYFFAVITASNLLPNRVPNVLTSRQIASGIGQSFTDGTATNICRYHSEGIVNDGVYGVLDHEVGHNWGVFLGSEVGEGHWRPNSTEHGLMADTFSDDGFTTIKKISGSPSAGFTWTSQDNLTKNETEVYSDGDLYLQGLGASFPDIHVLNTPVYNSNGTVSFNSVATYGQSWVEGRHGVRSPSYRGSPKRFRFGFIYVARNLEEIQQVFQPIERSIRQFTEAEAIDTIRYRFQVPFLVATRFRASIDARLADLDGNAAPDISITGSSYATTTNGSASFDFTTSDANGGTPTVSCIPASSRCAIVGNRIQISGLTPGAHFFTVKAVDSAGKRSFAHVVVDAS